MLSIEKKGARILNLVKSEKNMKKLKKLDKTRSLALTADNMGIIKTA